jgi:hypothetical protein
MEVFFKPGQACIANVGSVNEAKEVEESDGWDNVEVNLHPEARLCLLVKVHQGMPIDVRGSVAVCSHLVGKIGCDFMLAWWVVFSRVLFRRIIGLGRSHGRGPLGEERKTGQPPQCRQAAMPQL